MDGKRPISLADLRWVLGISRGELAQRLGITPEEVQQFEPEWDSMPPELKLMALLLMKLHQDAAKENQACPCWALDICPHGCSGRQTPDQKSWLSFAPGTPGVTQPSDPWVRCSRCDSEKGWFARPAQLNGISLRGRNGDLN